MKIIFYPASPINSTFQGKIAIEKTMINLNRKSSNYYF